MSYYICISVYPKKVQFISRYTAHTTFYILFVLNYIFTFVR